MVHSIQVTIGGGTNTPISALDLYVKQVSFQNNAANDMRVGGSEVTTTLGIVLKANSAGSASVLPLPQYPRAINLKDWYVAGTAAQVLDVTYVL